MRNQDNNLTPELGPHSELPETVTLTEVRAGDYKDLRAVCRIPAKWRERQAKKSGRAFAILWFIQDGDAYPIGPVTETDGTVPYSNMVVCPRAGAQTWVYVTDGKQTERSNPVSYAWFD